MSAKGQLDASFARVQTILRSIVPKTKEEQITSIHHISGGTNFEESFKPYLSRSLINGRECTTLRDTGTLYDVIPGKLINPNQLHGGTIQVRQPLMNNTRRLPTAEVEELGSIKTKAIVTDRKTNMPYYILENKTQELIDDINRKKSRSQMPRSSIIKRNRNTKR